MEQKFKRRVEQILNTIQISITDSKPKPQNIDNIYVAKFEKEVVATLDEHFDKNKDLLDRVEIEEEKKEVSLINEKKLFYSRNIEVCDEFDVILPLFADSVECELIDDVEPLRIGLDTLLSHLPKYSQSIWKRNADDSTFIMTEIKYWMAHDLFLTRMIISYAMTVFPDDLPFLILLYLISLAKDCKWSEIVNYDRLAIFKDEKCGEEGNTVVSIAFYMLGEYDLARNTLSKIDGVFSDHMRALCEYQGDNMPKCIVMCRKVIKMMSDLDRIRLEPFIVFARALSEQFDFAQAESMYQQATSIFPGVALAHIEYARFLSQFNKRGDEMKDQIAIALKSNDLSVYSMNVLFGLVRDDTEYLSMLIQKVMTKNTQFLINELGYHFIISDPLEMKLGRKDAKRLVSIDRIVQCSLIYGLCARYSGVFLNHSFGTIMTYMCYYLTQIECVRLSDDSKHYRKLVSALRYHGRNLFDLIPEFFDYLSIHKQSSSSKMRSKIESELKSLYNEKFNFSSMFTPTNQKRHERIPE